MVAPAPSPHPAPWWFSRVLFFIAAICALIAALCYTGTITGSPGLAWLAGALSAFFLGCAVA
jgi:hypothetical protein